MRISWNENEKRFEVQFSPGGEWENDKTAAQTAGFHCDGPPLWTWFTTKCVPLAKLRENRPASGLTITREALDAYNHLLEVEKKNEELKTYIKEQKKLQKKAQEHAKVEAQREEDGGEVEPEYEAQHYHEIPEYWKGKDEITRADLPAYVMARLDKHESIPQRRAEPTGLCVMCASPIYFYEKQDPPTCLWCESEEKFLDELL